MKSNQIFLFAICLLLFHQTGVAERPNILLLIADDASRGSFGCYGNQEIDTPHFDRIAREGVQFDHAYNCNPKCAPARACLLTGRYSWQLQEACNHQPILSDRWVFYPYLLEQAGYQIGVTGKGWGPGLWKGQTSGGSQANQDNPAGHPLVGNKTTPPFRKISSTDYAANFADFLDQRRSGTPFCFWLGTREPHRPYELDSWKKAGHDLAKVDVPSYYPDTDIVRGDLSDYRNEVEWFDRHIGESLAALQQRGLLKNTIVIATSDHGMPFPRVKGQLYDDSFHVPLAVRWPERCPPGRVVTDFVSFPDFAPTILEATQTADHPQITGRSFLNQITSSQDGRIDETRNHVLLAKERHDIGRTDGDRLSVGYPARGIRNDRFLLVKNYKPHRWPVGDPQYGFLNCDASPTKSLLLQLGAENTDDRFFQLAFGKRQAIELFDMRHDTDCVDNLANAPMYYDTRDKLISQMESELRSMDDPRVLGDGDIFDFYPHHQVERQQKLYGKPNYDPIAEFERRYGDD